MHSSIRSFRAPVAHKNKGFTLIEMAIVLAIAAIVLFGVFTMVSRANNARVATDEAQNFNIISSDMRTKFSTQGNYTGVTVENLVNLGAVPKHMVSGGTINTGWGTTVTAAVTNLTGTDDGVAFTYTVPRESCADFVTAASGASAVVSVDGTSIKNVPGGANTVNVAALGTACDSSAGGNVPVVLTVGR